MNKNIINCCLNPSRAIKKIISIDTFKILSTATLLVINLWFFMLSVDSYKSSKRTRVTLVDVKGVAPILEAKL